jgi:hypothetical protein
VAFDKTLAKLVAFSKLFPLKKNSNVTELDLKIDEKFGFFCHRELTAERRTYSELKVEISGLQSASFGACVLEFHEDVFIFLKLFFSLFFFSKFQLSVIRGDADGL